MEVMTLSSDTEMFSELINVKCIWTNHQQICMSGIENGNDQEKAETMTCQPKGHC